MRPPNHSTKNGRTRSPIRPAASRSAICGRCTASSPQEKVTALTFNDADKQIEICAKVVDNAEWAKVEEGVYTGFSQGGTYARRWTDETGAKRYTADPHEISLVDLPCLAEARFEMVKADGSHEWRRFKESTADLEKVGARNSAADLTRIQAMHDTSVELGAVCDAHKALHGTADDLAKRFDRLADTLTKSLAEFSKRLATIESQPQPLPMTMRTRSVAKHEDGLSDMDAPLADPTALSLLAIKLAQRQPR